MSWIPIQEAAKMLGVDRKTVWRWVKNCDEPDNTGIELTAHRAPGSGLLFIKSEDLDEFQRVHADDIAERRS